MSALETARRATPALWRPARGAARRRSRPGRARASLLPGVALLAFALAALCAPVLAPRDPDTIEMGVALAEPGAEYPLGTDQLGRDQLSRLLYGGRATLSLTLAGTLGIVTIGLLAGVAAGYAGGRVDLLISTVLTVLLALPSLLLTLAILGILGPGTRSLLIALIGAGWVGHARIFRASVLALREQPYVEAAFGAGASPARIVLRHLLPNLLPTAVVLATLDLGTLLLTVSSLSFLGMGVQPPTADWGVMLNDARPFFGEMPTLALAPGVCITAVALASNLLGDALRDLVDVGR
ncbi:MAG: Dipeptide transport system permease protein DppC [uncultured Thermomicrobiales bacterium]|uniref:Dipeptide transport system permease protein DppC n=1 Tax=uncultured Thermomicrobiales bacterium TaxID=1645740 RepID=A0A6J4VS53_9BACT|nr:MAG: Dipeptide transport system permease protein DppC [uncultured Thermomicrobiales bacterium]